MKQYSKIPSNLRSQISAIEPVCNAGIKYLPCAIIDKSSNLIRCVYIVEAESYFSEWGVWPENDRKKKAISIDNIASIGESSCRLPREFAEQIYRSGEAGMGYRSFSVSFCSASYKVIHSGGMVDFIHYPKGLTGSDVTGVSLGGRDGLPEILAANYAWCLYRNK